MEAEIMEHPEAAITSIDRETTRFAHASTIATMARECHSDATSCGKLAGPRG
jgi:hypothetical protein